MGTNFFKTGGFGGVTAGELGNYVKPVAKYMQYVSPGAHEALSQANKYNASQYVAPQPTPYYAGRTPTLADANAGYVTAANNVAQKLNPAQQQQPLNRAWMGGP
jgi:hypothetical protein